MLKFFGKLSDLLSHSSLVNSTRIIQQTTHSEGSLCVNRKALHVDGHQCKMLCSNLEESFQGTTIMITDEIYFLGAADVGLLSKNLKIACHIMDDSSVFGNINVVFAGDAAQLPPPKAVSLFDHTLLQCYESNDMNGLNEMTKHNVEGIVAQRQVNLCVVLKQIMRQKDPVFQNLLNQL